MVYERSLPFLRSLRKWKYWVGSRRYSQSRFV